MTPIYIVFKILRDKFTKDKGKKMWKKPTN